MDPNFKNSFARFESDTQAELLKIRDLILDVARSNDVIRELEETLKWGEPSYLTPKSKSGSTLRLGQTKTDQKPALYVNCQTTLVDEIRELYPDTFSYEGTRGIVLKTPAEDVRQELEHTIALVLTYHARKKSSKRVQK